MFNINLQVQLDDFTQNHNKLFFNYNHNQPFLLINRQLSFFAVHPKILFAFVGLTTSKYKNI